MLLNEFEESRRRIEDMRVALVSSVLQFGVEPTLAYVFPDTPLPEPRAPASHGTSGGSREVVVDPSSVPSSSEIDAALQSEVSGAPSEWVSSPPSSKEELEDVARLIERLSHGSVQLPPPGGEDWR